MQKGMFDMNSKNNIVKFGNESIKLIAYGLYHATVEIDDELYHNYDRDPLKCLNYIFDVKKRKGAGKFSDVGISGMYSSSDVKITIEGDMYSVVLRILDRDFTMQTYGRSNCLAILDELGTKRSHRTVESYRASLARYAWSLIMYGDTLRPESSN